MSELKACPFCGGELSIEKDDGSYLVICENCGYDLLTGPVGIGWWKSKEAAIANANSRPLEDALSKRVEELEETLKKERHEHRTEKADYEHYNNADSEEIDKLEAERDKFKAALELIIPNCMPEDDDDAAACILRIALEALKGGE